MTQQRKTSLLSSPMRFGFTALVAGAGLACAGGAVAAHADAFDGLPDTGFDLTSSTATTGSAFGDIGTWTTTAADTSWGVSDVDTGWTDSAAPFVTPELPSYGGVPSIADQQVEESAPNAVSVKAPAGFTEQHTTTAGVLSDDGGYEAGEPTEADVLAADAGDIGALQQVDAWKNGGNAPASDQQQAQQSDDQVRQLNFDLKRQLGGVFRQDIQSVDDMRTENVKLQQRLDQQQAQPQPQESDDQVRQLNFDLKRQLGGVFTQDIQSVDDMRTENVKLQQRLDQQQAQSSAPVPSYADPATGISISPWAQQVVGAVQSSAPQGAPIMLPLLQQA